ncbi:dienelactone hydrolase family protein [Altererythrobacter lutimaris]|uniref:Dienelactone hydrolase family protein n=1 Tax=Altererythrobacter lutimaris TaxID=2743979 RepID=A0A850H8B5_9SPHN|nr:dienelactone hydrolase family protein [Altererythrobacter lutimaris]NVE95407.1 dienelactone hydrolase family protein [Altererythrobacter lutimaris]
MSNTETVSIATLDGEASFNAYVARPEGAPKAAIIVIQEIFGVNPGIRKKCEDWASQGYLAVAPDLFFRMKPGLELDPDVEAEFNEALEYFGKYDPDDGVKDIAATIDWIRDAGETAKVGCVGYCLGGRLAYMAAARTDVDASVGYYGVMIDQMLDEKDAIANPLLLHIPTADHFVGPEAQAAMHAGLDGHEKVTLYDYEGLDHGFAAEMGNRRNEKGAQLADGRTSAFFAEHLG